MKTLGFIYSEEKINGLPPYIKITFDKEIFKQDSIPILVIGFSNAKNVISDFKKYILKHKINDNLFWTFARNEKRSLYLKHLDDFFSYCINKDIDAIKYKYVDILKIGYTTSKKLISVINNDEEKYIYISGQMAYMYYKSSIIGISLKILSFCGYTRERVIKMVSKNKKNIIKLTDDFCDNSIKKYLINKYAMAYYMSIL